MKTQNRVVHTMNRKRVARALKMLGRQNFRVMAGAMRYCRCASQRKLLREWLKELNLPEWARQAMENRYFFGS